jgi:hypothetical protein
MNHHGLLANAARGAEKAVHAIVDSDLCQHSLCSLSSENYEQIGIARNIFAHVLSIKARAEIDNPTSREANDNLNVLAFVRGLGLSVRAEI